MQRDSTSKVPRQGNRTPNILSLLIGCCFAGQAISFLYYVERAAVLSPFWDMITWIDDYLKVIGAASFRDYLWKNHNEHRLVLVRLMTALDISVFHQSELVFVVTSVLSVAAAAWIAFDVLRRDPAFSGEMRALACLGPMLLLTAAAAVDCALPIDSVYPIALVFLVAAIVLFDGERERTHFTALRRGAAFAAAFLSSLGNAVGLVAWPVLLWTAWRAGASRRWLLLIGCIGAGYGLLYVNGLPAPALGGPGHFYELHHLRQVVLYLLTYLGLPLSRAPGLVLPSRLLGSALLAAGVFSVARDAFASAPATRLHRIAIGFVLASLAASCLAAVGRVDLDAEVKVPVRYAMLVAPLHVGLLALAVPLLGRHALTAGRRIGLLSAGAALAIALVATQLASGQAAVAAAAAISSALKKFDAGIREPGMETVVFPDLAVAERVLAQARSLGPARPRN